MARYQLTTQPPVNFDDLKAGQVALMLSSGIEPPVRLRDTVNPQREWVAAHGVVFPKGALLVHITTQQWEDDTEDDTPRVEVFNCDHIGAKPMQVAVSVRQLMKMIADGVVEMDSSSGEDENLHYHYDYYLVV